jgi:hypothetical protein
MTDCVLRGVRTDEAGFQIPFLPERGIYFRLDEKYKLWSHGHDFVNADVQLLREAL